MDAGHAPNDAGRAVAAYFSRRRFGWYAASEVTAALGYRGHGSV